MGAKDSKPNVISYEDAVKRVSESELRRIRDAYKRCSGQNSSTLSIDAFVREVLCDGVPLEVADWLYNACGGTRRGIPFRELLCGLVVLTKGTIEEKIKFLWTLYVSTQTDNSAYLYKWDFIKALQLESISLPTVTTPRASELLTGLFGVHGDKVIYEQFRSWLLIHKDATVLSKWLLVENCVNLTSDLETPTFYQSLAGVTHLEERDIIELEKCFWSLRNTASSGQLDVEALTVLVSPPLPSNVAHGVFLAFDENRDGHVDFKELCCGLSAACRGPSIERLKFCFKIFDVDHDAILNQTELHNMMRTLAQVANESHKNNISRSPTPTGTDTEEPFIAESMMKSVCGRLKNHPHTATKTVSNKPVFDIGGPTAEREKNCDDKMEPNGTNQEVSINEDDGYKEHIMQTEEITKQNVPEQLVLTQEDFLIWSVETAEALVTPFLDLIFQVCHIVLGLRPQCKHQERDIVLGWLWREVRRGYMVGQFWYLVSAEWWFSWLGYTQLGMDASLCCARLAHKGVDEAVICDESFTSNSTESMGSLLGRADSLSLHSASSSGVSSGASAGPLAATNPRNPGHIDNKRLLGPNNYKVRTLTGEGGHLRRDVTLSQHRDFELVPETLWRALAHWYGGPQPLPRQVIRPPNAEVELELYPLTLRLLRHMPSTQPTAASWSGMVGGYGAAALSSVSAAASRSAPERQLLHTAAFSRLATVKQVSEFLCSALGLGVEDVRLWQVAGGGLALLEEERVSLSELAFEDGQRVLLEVRNKDLTWPEEIGALSVPSAVGSDGAGAERRGTLGGPLLPGTTGLHNLGNTCFMNAALQAVWNTGPLTRYFNSGMHLYEVNTTNPLGTRGVLAIRFADLCKEVWSSATRSVAPLRVRWCVQRHAPHLAGGGQHDAQEMLAWLLDRLHEDLNRAEPRATAPPLHDSDGRPDEVVAAEAWEQHAARNASIVTDLFYGQLKSKVRCAACAHESVRFDAFNMLSLPLPMESYVHCEMRVILLDGSTPIKYGIRANTEDRYSDLKVHLSKLCGLRPAEMLLVELNKALIGRMLEDGAKIKSVSALRLMVYQLPYTDEDVPSEGDKVNVCGNCDDSLDKCRGPHSDSEKKAQQQAHQAEGPTLAVFHLTLSVNAARQMFMVNHLHPAGLNPNTGASETSTETHNRHAGNTLIKRTRLEGCTLSKSPVSTFYTNKCSQDDSSFEMTNRNFNHTTDLQNSPASTNISSDIVKNVLIDSENRSPSRFITTESSVDDSKESPLTKKLHVEQNVSQNSGDELKSVVDSPKRTIRLPDTNILYRRDTSTKLKFLVAAHRKQYRQDTYFLSQHKTRSALFGVPLVVPIREGMSSRELYVCVWSQVTRLLSARPPTPPDQANHATDCDDSLGYTFPFSLCAVRSGAGAACGEGAGVACALCPWPRFCRGCVLPCDDRPFILNLTANPSKNTSDSSVTGSPVLSSSNSPTVRTRHNRPHATASATDVVHGTETSQMSSPQVENELTHLDFSELVHLVHGYNQLPGIMLAIDWDPTALHLRYQTTLEQACVDHESVGLWRRELSRAVGLAHCLRAFTAEERLEQPYHCSRCRAAQPATKKLQIWKLPPILVVHLKRFQYVNNRWIKSQKVVNFPFHDFDPTDFLASVPQETILRSRDLKFDSRFRRRSTLRTELVDTISESESSSEDEDDDDDVRNEIDVVSSNIEDKSDFEPKELRLSGDLSSKSSAATLVSDDLHRSAIDTNRLDEVKWETKKASPERERRRLESTSLATTPVLDHALVDYHQHKLTDEQDKFQLKYRLYAVVSHSGQMSGGHYVSYARNPNGSWYCYNDSSCREMSLVTCQHEPHPVPPIDPSAAYLLFYEREGLDYQPYLPDTQGKEPLQQLSHLLDGDDSDFKKMCVIS